MATVRFTYLSSACLVALFCCFNAKTEAQEVRWQLESGVQFEVRIDQISESETRCQTLKRITSTHIFVDMDWNVLEAADNKAVIEQKITRIKMEMSTPTNDGSNRVVIDTQVEDGQKLGSGVEKEVLAELKAMVGLTAKVSMTSRGEITDVEVDESTMDKLRQAASSTPLIQMMSGPGMKELFRQSTFVLPSEKIEPGFEWPVTRSLAGPFGKLELRDTFRYEGEKEIDGRQFQSFSLSASLESQQPLPAGDNAADPPPTLKNLAGKGTFLFDPQIGVFTSANSTMAVNTQKIYRDLEIDTTLTSTTQLSIKKRFR